MDESDVVTELPHRERAGDTPRDRAGGGDAPATTLPGPADATLPGDATMSGTGAPRRAASEQPRLPARGETIGKFVIVKKLGAGAMGVVMLAFDPELDRSVAIKLLITHDRSEVAQARLVREARSAAKIQHPNVIAVHEVGMHDGQVFVVMEYVDGGTLRTWQQTPRRRREIVAVYRQAGRGLAAAHAAGLVHRDFKPDNVLIGADRRVRVSDFGLVGIADTTVTASLDTSKDERLTQTGAMMGTPAYMSPEQVAAGDVDTRSDQFSFCVALYEALFGMRPFAGDTLPSLVLALQRGQPRPPPPSRVPPRIRAAIMRGLARDPADRHASMDALLAELSLRRWQERRVLVLAGAVSLVSIGGAAVAMIEPARSCASPVEAFADTWDEAQRSAGRTAWTNAESFARIDRALADRGASWREAWAAACDAYVQGRDPPAIWTMRQACLLKARDEVRSFVSLLGEPDPIARPGLAAVAMTVGAVHDCADVASLQARAQPQPSQDDAIGQARPAILHAQALYAAYRFGDALSATQRLLPNVRAIDHGALTAEVLLVRARAGMALGRFVDHEAELREAINLAANDHAYAIETRALATLIAGLAMLPGRQAEGLGSIAAAESAGERANDPSARADLQIAIGRVRLATGDGEAARTAFDEAVTRAAEQAPTLLAPALQERGVYRIGIGEIEGGRADLARSREVIDMALGSDHRAIATAWGREGEALLAHGDNELAEAAYEHAVASCTIAFGPDHSDTIAYVIQLARAAIHRGAYEIGRERILDARARFVRLGNGDLVREAVIMENLAWLDAATGRDRDAVESYTRAAELLHTIGGDAAARLPTTYQGLGWTWWRLHDMSKARAAFEQARDRLIAQHGPKHESLLEQIAAIGDTYQREGDCAAAQSQYRRALRLLNDLELPPGAHLARVLLAMGQCELVDGDLESASETLARAYELRDTPGLAADFRAPIAFARAQVLARRGDRSTAIELAREALAIYESEPVAWTDEMAEIRTWLRDHGAR